MSGLFELSSILTTTRQLQESMVAEKPIERQAAMEAMRVWMEARDASAPRSLQYKEFDRLYRKAKLAFEDLDND
jgi:hypothetical protein